VGRRKNWSEENTENVIVSTFLDLKFCGTEVSSYIYEIFLQFLEFSQLEVPESVPIAFSMSLCLSVRLFACVQALQDFSNDSLCRYC